MGAVCCFEEPVDLEREVELPHFVLLSSVGKGAFGKVRVVEHKGTKKLYALKYINKKKCIAMKAIDNILSERSLLEHIDYSLVVNLRYAFQDDENLFMVIDLMLGGDLRFHLDRMHVLPEIYVQFYAAEVSLTLNSLHTKNIIHRDVKPDNILLDEHGHAHLTDFNVAVRMDQNRTRPLTTIAGSLAYIAPEILLKQGYSYSVDWWSLGIVLYELLYGRRPFRAEQGDLQTSIMLNPIDFPEKPVVSPDAMDFIQGLLNRDISQRLGVGEAGFERLKAHPWMKETCWDTLLSKTASAPFIPNSKASNFDPTYELEEILLEENPLRVKKRKVKPTSCSKGEASCIPQDLTDIEFLEQSFLVYDYTKTEEYKRNSSFAQSSVTVTLPVTVDDSPMSQKSSTPTGSREGISCNI